MLHGEESEPPTPSSALITGLQLIQRLFKELPLIIRPIRHDSDLVDAEIIAVH